MRARKQWRGAAMRAVLSEQDDTFSLKEEQGTALKAFLHRRLALAGVELNTAALRSLPQGGNAPSVTPHTNGKDCLITLQVH